MFSPSTVHVLPFDPHHGCDSARQYAGKYASKPEKWYYLETERDGVKDFLKCRTVGLCMAHNRLLNFHVVRSTKPVLFTPTSFVPEKDSKTEREPLHMKNYPDYPDPQYYLTLTPKYFFRHESLRHLRIEQFNRYFALVGEGDAVKVGATVEDTNENEEEDEVAPETHHRHFDERTEALRPGTHLPASVKHVEGARRRQQARLAVSRVPFIEPLGMKREAFYEQRLLLSLPWYCPEKPAVVHDDAGQQDVEWCFAWTPPSPEELGGAVLCHQELRISTGRPISFEQLCADTEKELCRAQHDLVCACCAGDLASICKACLHAVGFHRCEKTRDASHLRWRKGTLHNGEMDIERVIYNLHRKGLPLHTLREKADAFVDASNLSREKADSIIQIIEQERGTVRVANDIAAGEVGADERARLSSRLTPAELQAELDKREAFLREGAEEGGVTDQWRVYSEIVKKIQAGEWLRMMVQASAGTGKSFLLTTVYLWCLVHGHQVKAAAPTGIAAANIEIEGTDVTAQTVHSMFDLDTAYQSKLDFAKLTHAKVAALMALKVLLLDEVSMMDTDCFTTIAALCSNLDHSRHPNAHGADSFGKMHVILFGDFKYLGAT